MKNTVKIKKDKDDNLTFDLAEILKGTNIKVEDVAFYSLTEAGDSMTLLLFDKDNKQLMVKDA